MSDFDAPKVPFWINNWKVWRTGRTFALCKQKNCTLVLAKMSWEAKVENFGYNWKLVVLLIHRTKKDFFW